QVAKARGALSQSDSAPLFCFQLPGTECVEPQEYAQQEDVWSWSAAVLATAPSMSGNGSESSFEEGTKQGRWWTMALSGLPSARGSLERIRCAWCVAEKRRR